MNWSKARIIGKGILFGIGALVFASLIALLYGWVLMILWNWLMPVIFSLPSITYWQAWGLILMSHLLFKGHGHSGPPSHKSESLKNKQHYDDFGEFKNDFHKKWHDRWKENLEPEQENDELERL